MADDVIKNPARKTSHATREPYTPEYVRLGRDPVVNEVNKGDFMIGRKAKKRYSLTETSEPSSMGPLPRSQSETKKTDEAVRWFDESEDNADIPYDEIELPPEVKNLAEDEVQETDEEDVSLNGMLPGEYCVFVCGALISSCMTREEAELLIQQVLCEDYDSHEVTINDIMLLKRLPIKVGVLSVE